MHKYRSPSNVPSNGSSLWACLVAALVLFAGVGGATAVSAQKFAIAAADVATNNTQGNTQVPAVPLLDISFIDSKAGVDRAFLVLTPSNNSKVSLPQMAASPCIGDCSRDAAVGSGSYLATAIANATIAADGNSDLLAEQAVNTIANRGIDQLERALSGYGPIRNLEITYIAGRNALPKELRVDAILALLETDKSTILGQVGLFDNGSVATAHNGFNLGVGYRHLISDDMLVGVNAFYDYLDGPTVSRYSLGGELKGDWYDVSANWYSGFRDGAAANNGRVESADGWDIEVAGRMPEVPWVEFSGKYYNFDGLPGKDDQSGTDFGVRFEPIPLLGAEARYNIPEDGSSEFYALVNLKYRFGVSLAEHINPQRVQVSPVKNKRYDRVRREYQQRLNTFAPPPSNNVSLSVVTASDPTGASLRWLWLDLGAGQADVRWGQVPVVDDNYSSPSRDPVVRSGSTGATIVEGLIPGITYQFNVRLFAAGSANPITVTGNTVTFTVPGTPPQRPRVNARSTASRIITGESGVISFDVQPRPSSPVTVQFNLSSTGVAQGYTLTTAAGGGNLLTLGGSGGSIEIPANSDSVTLNLVPGTSGVDNTASGVFTLNVVSGSGYNLGDLPSTTVQIVPASTPIASVRSSTSSTFEGGSVQFSVTLDPVPSGPVSVVFAISGSNISDSDYSLSGTGLAGTNTVNFIANQASSVVTLTVVDDSDMAAESLMFSIETGTGYLPSATRGEAMVRISPLPLVGISAAATSIVGGGQSVITISVDPPPAQNTMVVFFSIANTGLATGDFSISGGSSEITVSIAPGQSSAQITLNVPTNSRANGSLVVALEENSGYNTNNLARSVTISVSGRPQIGVTASRAQLIEGELTTVTFRADPAPQVDLSVAYSLSAVGSAGAEAGDFTLTLVGSGSSAGSGTAVILAGSSIVQLQFLANDDDDSTESASIVITAPTETTPPYTVNPASNQVTLTVYPALPVVTSRASTVAIAEGEQATITLRAEAAPAVTAPVAVMFTLSDQSASGITAADFSLMVGGATVPSAVGTAIAANVTPGTALDIVITAVDDGDTTSEMLQLAVDTAGGTYTSSSQPILITINPRLDEVAALTATSNPASTGEISLRWTSPISNCATLEIAVTPIRAGGPPPTQTCTPGVNQNLLVSNLLSATEYTFTVTVIDFGGNRSRGERVTHTAP